MLIAMIASGSRGDVQPYVALGKGLVDAGHQVHVATHQDYEQLVIESGLTLFPVEGKISAVIQGQSMRDLIEGGNFLAMMSEMSKLAKVSGVYMAKAAMAASQGADLVLAGMGGDTIGIAIAEKLGLPFLPAYLVPFSPTRAFASVLTANLPVSAGFINLLTHKAAKQLMWQGFRSADSTARREVIGLPSAPFFGPDPDVGGRKFPRLYGYSPSVLPPPPDWDADKLVTGYWFLDANQDWQPPQDLLNFLEAGPPPVYIGFGSLSSRDPQATTDLILRSVKAAGVRAVLFSGSDALARAALPDTVFMTSGVPHVWLFPRMTGVVHHGGVGTTAAGLRAGVPAMVVPFFGDQPFWGKQVAQLGVGPVPVPRKKLTVETLAAGIQALVSNEDFRRKAAQLGEKIRAEDGVGRAVEVISRVVTG